jgi:hypothetical protein
MCKRTSVHFWIFFPLLLIVSIIAHTERTRGIRFAFFDLRTRSDAVEMQHDKSKRPWGWCCWRAKSPSSSTCHSSRPVTVMDRKPATRRIATQMD